MLYESPVELSRAILEVLLAEEDPRVAVLRMQAASAKLEFESGNPAGFYCKVIPRDGSPRLSGTGWVGNATFSVEGEPLVGGGMLHITDGILDDVEGYTLAEGVLSFPMNVDCLIAYSPMANCLDRCDIQLQKTP